MKPTPKNNEIIIDPKKVIMSKTNYKGLIEFANEYFTETSGYSKYELIGKAHNIVRHPDMPKVVFKMMWDKLRKGENLYAIIKNLAKDGSFYWVVTKFETTFDSGGNILSHYARRKAVPTKVVENAESIYKMILTIEKYDPKLAEETFIEILENQKLTYDDFFLEVAGMSEVEVYDYFQDNELNINTTSKDIITEIDTKEKIQKKTMNSFLGSSFELELKEALKLFRKK
ncbi:MAG: PAS domain-containing protein [Flavobacteriaceae bacterium]|nr:PAS domain-containing protein [Flavobacteriaceae bacterium]